MQNLQTVDIMVHCVGAPRGGTIYRLAQNALVVGPDNFDERLAALQNTLKLPTQARRGSLVATTPYTISKGILDVDPLGARVTVAQIAGAGDATLHAVLQPVEAWQQARRTLRLAVNARLQDSSSASDNRIHLQPFLDAAAHARIDLAVQLPKFRALRAGETAASVRDQFERVLRARVQQQLRRTPP